MNTRVGTPGVQGDTGPTGPTGAMGPTGSTGATGPQGPAGANGTNGANGTVPTYGPSGLLSGVKMWVGTTTTNSSGQWTINYSSAGFSTVLNVQPTAISTALTGAAAVSTVCESPSASSCTGACFIPNAISLLGLLPLQAAGAGLTVQVLVIGQ